MSRAHEKVQKIELVGLQELVPYEKNPRKHGKGIDELVKSITENGFTNPIQIDQNNRIIAGHGRFQAAKRLNLNRVPCVRLDVTDQEYHKLLISDNKIGELSKWDNKLLQDTMLILGDLKDLEIPGFSLEDIDKVFGHKHNDVSASSDVDFGDSGKVPDASDDDALIKRKTFVLTDKEYRFIDEKLKAVKKEHNLNTEAEALIEVLKGVKSLTKVVTKKAAVKNIEVYDEN
jgi:hypothetical protein